MKCADALIDCWHLTNVECLLLIPQANERNYWNSGLMIHITITSVYKLYICCKWTLGGKKNS